MDVSHGDLEAKPDDSDDSDDGLTELTRYSLETQTTQMYGLVWCPADDTCTCLFHESVRSGSWRPDLIITNIRHYPDGPVHQLFSANNECGGCREILDALHRQRFGPECQCWWCAGAADRAVELAEVGYETDGSDNISFIEEDIPLMVRRSDLPRYNHRYRTQFK